MILDSLFRITRSEIKRRNGKLPKTIVVTRSGKRFFYPIEVVISIASRIAEIPINKNDPKQPSFLVNRASYLIHRARLNSPVGGWAISDKEKVNLDGINLIDLRKGFANGLSGLAADRVAAIFDPKLTTFKSASHHYALMNALANVDVIIVDNDRQSFILQDYLTKRVFLTIVLTDSQVQGYFEGTKLEGFEDKKVVAHG